MKTRHLLLPVVVALGLCPATGFAQAASDSSKTEDVSLAKLFSNPLAKNAEKKIMSEVKSPDMYNSLLKQLTNSLFTGGALKVSELINDLNLHVRTFNPSNKDGSAALGVAYAFNRPVAGRTLYDDSVNPVAVSFNLKAKGEVAFDKDTNPNDFLQSGLSINLFGSRGGWQPMAKDFPVPKPGEQSELGKLSDALDLNLPADKLDSDPHYRAYWDYVRSRLSTQVFYNLSAEGSLESNQSFSDKQWAYGLKLGTTVRAWNTKSPLARFNLLDWPFAAIRWVTGEDAVWSPSGQALPVIAGGIDLVDPYSNKTRLAIDPDKATFPRLHAQVGIKTKVARLYNQPVWFSGGLRYHKEISPSNAIRAAHLDEFRFFVAEFEFLGKFTATYANGKLPLDRKADNTYSLGWKMRF